MIFYSLILKLLFWRRFEYFRLVCCQHHQAAPSGGVTRRLYLAETHVQICASDRLRPRLEAGGGWPRPLQVSKVGQLCTGEQGGTALYR